MQELQDDGIVVRGHKRRIRKHDRLPDVTVVDILGPDDDGELLATPVTKDDRATLGEAAPPILLLSSKGDPALAAGDRVLAKLRGLEDGSYEGRLIKRLPKPSTRIVGIVERTRRGLLLSPLSRGTRHDLTIDPGDLEGLGAGDLVVAERLERRPGEPSVRVKERIGHAESAGAISLLAAFEHDLRMAFPPDVTMRAEQALPVGLEKGRIDLRQIPFVTIDGADAKDFDDAVFAKADTATDNPGGWQIKVAIADVAHYVRPGDPLDVEARERGNSVYFPDRVLPMLPEALSNGLCSLRPAEDRACLVVHITLDHAGNKRQHRFERGLMRSHARLTYEQLQAARDDRPDETTNALLKDVVTPLYGAYEALQLARKRRGTLDLDLPEMAIDLDPASGEPAGVTSRARLDAHRLIEEFMISANVAAAESLEKAATPCMYRVHDRPDASKLESLGQLISNLGITSRPTLGAAPKDLSRLIEKTRDHPLSPLVSSLLLRAQSQAVYTPHNIGHFGLNLGRYAHFTSPIRRYADLIVHRGLIRALKLGAGAMSEEVEIEALEEVGAHISSRERRAMEAERGAKSRFIAMFMADKIGARFAARITSVHRFGLFVQLEGIMADALVPISTLSANRLEHDATHHLLIDRSSGDVFGLGDPVEVELVEVDRLSGRLACRLTDHTPTRPINKARNVKKKTRVHRKRR